MAAAGVALAAAVVWYNFRKKSGDEDGGSM